MAKKIKQNARWVGGISDFLKEGTEDSYYFGRGVDHRSDPRSISLLPKAVKESGSIVEDLPKWADIVGTDTYVYGDAGKIYLRTQAGVWSKLGQASDSHGNGMSYFGEDDFIYFTTDTTIGRYGPISSPAPNFVYDYLASQGGVPLNTNSLRLIRASSQYASRADTASLSITGDLSIEAQIKPTSLPATGESFVIASKWNESGNIRSYKFDITTESNYFGDGSDGALVIGVNTTDTPIDSACSGTIGTTTLTATNASFATGQIVLIIQMYNSASTSAGAYQRNKISSYTAGTITLDQPLNATYGPTAQVIVMKQYTDVTVNGAKTWTAKAWNGTTGGILTFLASGTVTNNGTITATDKGFRGGATVIGSGFVTGMQGEGTGGTGTRSRSANGNGGGGGADLSVSGFQTISGGAGGSNATQGGLGENLRDATNKGTPGVISSTADLTTMTLGGGGGAGGDEAACGGYAGRNGGGIIYISGNSFTNAGTITANGSSGDVQQNTCQASNQIGQSGAGAGGSILIKSQIATLGSGTITALGGAATTGTIGPGGNGGNGAVVVNYFTSYTGTTNPTLNPIQDSTLGASDGYVLRLQVSSNGTAVTSFSKAFNPVIDKWQEVAVTFDSATTDDATKSEAVFYLDSVSVGSQRQATTTISDNASEFFIGANKNGAGTAVNFYDGYIDEVRLFATVRTQSDIFFGLNTQILTTIPYIKGYWKLNGDYADATVNANTLAGTNAPTFSIDVPYPSPTTRLDIDQQATTTGNTYTLSTSISESATNRKTFTPAKDPQKSISVLIAAVGTGDWTLTVHDQFNNIITSKTVANASLGTGYYEFVFATPWRPLLNANYHFHLTSTVADGTVTTTNVNDLETVSFRTYFQFLVTDTEWHPVAKMLQFLVFGNERYVGTYEATLFNPNTLTLPAGYRVRCFGYYKEYLAIGTMRGSTITEQDSGRIYFWDGIASTYNFYIDVPEGGINALLGAKGKLFVWAGYQGDQLIYQGGDTAEQIKRVPLIEEDKYIEIYPGAVSMWNMLVRYGVAGGGDSDDVQRGVYTWGSRNVRYPDSLSYDYPLSTGLYNSSVKIGLIIVVNKKLLVGWQTGVAYGVDYIATTNDPQSSGEIQMVLDDDGAMWKEKEVMEIVANFEPLNSGESIDLKYKLDRNSIWQNLGAVTTAGETIARLVVSGGGSRYHEIQYGADLATTTTTSPKLLDLSIKRDFLETEDRFG